MSRQGNRLRTIAALSDVHLGRTITIADLTGTLAGLIPLNNHTQAVLIVGSSRIFTDALPADTVVEVWQKGATP